MSLWYAETRTGYALLRTGHVDGFQRALSKLDGMTVLRNVLKFKKYGPAEDRSSPSFRWLTALPPQRRRTAPTGGRGQPPTGGWPSSSPGDSIMVQITRPDDFKEFLRLLGARGVEYLLVGGYAVGHHGYPRYTADIDVWVPVDLENARRLTVVLRDFGFDTPDVTPELFLREQTIVRMGGPGTPDRSPCSAA